MLLYEKSRQTFFFFFFFLNIKQQQNRIWFLNSAAKNSLRGSSELYSNRRKARQLIIPATETQNSSQ